MHGERRHESFKLGSSAVPVIAHDDGYSFDSSYLCCLLPQRLMLLHVYSESRLCVSLVCMPRMK